MRAARSARGKSKVGRVWIGYRVNRCVYRELPPFTGAPCRSDCFLSGNITITCLSSRIPVRPHYPFLPGAASSIAPRGTDAIHGRKRWTPFGTSLPPRRIPRCREFSVLGSLLERLTFCTRQAPDETSWRFRTNSAYLGLVVSGFPFPCDMMRTLLRFQRKNFIGCY